MISIVFVIAVLAGFLVSASIGVIYLKPGCPKCGSRAAVVYRKGKASGKKRGISAYYCEDCQRDFKVKKGQPVCWQAKALLVLGALCLAVFVANHTCHMIRQDRTLVALRENASLTELANQRERKVKGALPGYGDYEYYVYKRTTKRPEVEAFLDTHRDAKRLDSDERTVTYALRYGFLPSSKLTVTFDDQGRYLDQKPSWW